MKRILIVKTTSMGDVIHALPVLNDVHAHDPSIQIDWMVEEPFADLVRGSSHIHEVVPVNLRKWRKQGLRYTWQQWKLLRNRLADRQYDAIVDLQGLIKSAVLARTAKGTLMGPGFSYAKESLACLFYSKRAGWDPQAHAVERLRELAAGLLGYRLLGKPVFYDVVPQKVLPAIPRGAEIWFLHATARDEKKWPVVKWRELAHRFSDLGYAVKLPWGSDAEQQQAEKIASGIARVEVLPRMALGELRLRLEKAGLVIGVDTGITHLAAAHYLPMVALFFATPAWRFAPRFNPHAISLGDVGREPVVGEVFEAATRLLREINFECIGSHLFVALQPDSFLLQPVLALYLLKRGMRQPEYRHGWGQRFFARLPVFRAVSPGQQRIWVHAVSVGEAHAVSPLVQHWAKVYPQHEWAVSCTTPTGLATCRQLYSTLNQVQFFYLPYDLPYLVARTLKQVRAHSLWVVETELWPNLLLGAAKAKVHTALLNARVSPNTGKRLAQLGLVSRPVLQSVGTLIAQTQADAAVFEKIGRPVDAVCGNLKFDVALKPDLATMGRDWREAAQAEQVVLFASSREGEEALLLDALNRCQFFKRMPKASVWIVPRHPQRFDAVFELMAEAATRMGVARPVRRSASFNAGSNIALAGFGQARLVLGDSMGEMPAYYSVADLALLGGSWLPFGGQNLIEACAYGCPVWMGPNTFNFAKAAEDALAAKAARRFEHLLAACEFYLSGFQGFDEAKKAAFAYARGHRGATQRSFDVLNLPTQLPAADRLSEPKAD